MEQKEKIESKHGMSGRQAIADEWSYKILGADMKVHRVMGPGLLESVHKTCMIRECELQRIPFNWQIPVSAQYKERHISEGFRADIIVDNASLVELKSRGGNCSCS